MSKVIKQMQLTALKNNFSGVRDMVMLSVSGLDAITDNKVRLDLRKKGIRLQVVKNSLCRKVFGEMGFSVEKAWGGTTTVAWGGNSIADLSKEIETLAKKHEKFIKVKSAVADGQEIGFAEALTMPTLAQALGQVVGLAMSPAARLASALNGPAGYVAGQLKTLSERAEEAAAAAPAAEATPSAPA